MYHKLRLSKLGNKKEFLASIQNSFKKVNKNASLTLSSLFFQQVKASDAGSYSVLASNTAGAAECMAVIGVKGDCWKKIFVFFFKNLNIKNMVFWPLTC